MSKPITDSDIIRAMRNAHGPWLGQACPGDTPAEFFPEIFDTDRRSFGTTFSADGKAFYFGFQRPGPGDVHDILMTLQDVDTWSDPSVLPFNSDVSDLDHCLSADGTRMFWRSWRLLPEETEERPWSYLWWAEQGEDGWSDARLLKCEGENLRTGYPAIGRSGALYYTARGNGGKVSIMRARPSGTDFAEPEEIIKGMAAGGDMCVAPDESLLVITCKGEPENLGRGDLFVSFRNEDGSWTALQHAGELVNTAGEDINTHCPMITPDGAYLFYRVYNFTSGRGRVFWVKARFLHELR